MGPGHRSYSPFIRRRQMVTVTVIGAMTDPEQGTVLAEGRRVQGGRFLRKWRLETISEDE